MRRLVNLFQNQVTVSEICVIGRKVCKGMEDRNCEVVDACNGHQKFTSLLEFLSGMLTQALYSIQRRENSSVALIIGCQRIGSVQVIQTLKIALFMTSLCCLLLTVIFCESFNENGLKRPYLFLLINNLEQHRQMNFRKQRTGLPWRSNG